MCVLCREAGFLGEAVEGPGESFSANLTPTVQALLSSANPGWSGTNGAPFVVNYSFAQDPEAGSAPAGFRPFDAAQQVSTRQALAAWSSGAGLVFVEVPDRPGGQGIDIRFSFQTLPPNVTGQASYPPFGTVLLSTERVAHLAMTPGGTAHVVLLHEIGHALGLKHPFDASGANGAILPASQDNWLNTVMSYTETGTIPTGPGPFDREATQYIYGLEAQRPAWVRNAGYDAATNAVRLPGDDTPETIVATTSRANRVDAGGGDDRVTLGTQRAGDAGHWVFLGPGDDHVVRTGSGSSHVWGGEGNDFISLGMARDAGDNPNFGWGEAGNDTISGGSSHDRLFGGLGDDRLVGGGGNDWLAGGFGTNNVSGTFGVDTVAFEAARRSIDLGLQRWAGPADGSRPREFFGTARNSTETTEYASIENYAFLDGRLVHDPNDPAVQLYRLYDAALDRLPDSVGLNGWIATVQAGVPLAAVAQALATSGEFAARFGAPGNAAFVQVAYRNALGRDAEAPALAAWTAALDAGRARGDLLVTLADSGEMRARLAPALNNGLWDQDEGASAIARLYQTVLGRRPDEAGLRGWDATMEAGATPTMIANAFLTSGEFAARNGAPGDAALVTLAYRNALGRDPQAADLAGWGAALARGGDRGAMLATIAESPEAVLRSQSWIEGGILFA